MSESKSKWKHIIEGLVVLSSILIAFAIDAAWDSHKTHQVELAALAALRAEMESNREILEQRLTRNRKGAKSINRFLRATPDEIATFPKEELEEILTSLWAPYTFDPEFSATRAFVEKTTLTSEHSREVWSALVQWERLLADAEEEKSALWMDAREVHSLLAHYAVDLPPEVGDWPGLHQIKPKIGMHLRRIRGDTDLIAGTIAKWHLQKIYIWELEDLLEHIDAVLALLEQDDR